MLLKVHYICVVHNTLHHVGQHWSIVHDIIVNDSIVDDMDEPTDKLIGRHNYCTQVSIGYQNLTFTYALCMYFYTYKIW